MHKNHLPENSSHKLSSLIYFHKTGTKFKSIANLSGIKHQIPIYCVRQYVHVGQEMEFNVV